MDGPGNVSEKSQDNVEAEVDAEAFLQEDGEGGQHDGERDTKNVLDGEGRRIHGDGPGWDGSSVCYECMHESLLLLRVRRRTWVSGKSPSLARSVSGGRVRSGDHFNQREHGSRLGSGDYQKSSTRPTPTARMMSTKLMMAAKTTRRRNAGVMNLNRAP